MGFLSRLASQQGRRDEGPNKDLALELVANKNLPGIQEIADNLWSQDSKIQTDCLTVLEFIGMEAPELIENCSADFLDLLSSKNNRLVWGAMTNLSLIALRQPEPIMERLQVVIQAVENGSIITQDRGIKTLALVAAVGPLQNAAIFPFLVQHLGSCRSKSVPQHAESVQVAVTPQNQDIFLKVLHQRLEGLTATQRRRVEKVIRAYRG